MDLLDLEEELQEYVQKNTIPTNCYLRNALSSNKGPILLGEKESTNYELNRGARLLSSVLEEQGLLKENIFLDNWKNSARFFQAFLNQPLTFPKNSILLDQRFDLNILINSLNYHGPSYYSLAGFDFTPFEFTPKLQAQIRLFLSLHQFVLKIRKEVLTEQIYQSKSCLGNLIGSSSWVLVHPIFFGGMIGEGQRYLYPWDSFLAMTKILASRLNILIFSELSTNEFSNFPSRSLLIRNWSLWDSLIAKRGEMAVPLLKKYEPLCLAFLSVLSRDVLDLESSFRKSTVQEFKLLLKDIFCEEYWPLFKNFYSSLPNVETLYELFGLFRTFAFPHVDSRQTLGSIAEHGMKPHSWKIDEYILDQANTRMEFYRRYLQAYRTPPALDLKQLSCTSYLYSCLIRGIMPNIHHERYQHREWFLISFQKSVDWEISDSLSTYLSDKASSPIVSDWIEYLEQGKQVPIEERRLLLKFLNSNDSSVEKVLSEYQEIYDDPELRIISIKVKECELKKKGRGFGIMTYKMRLLQVIREVLAKRLSKLFPEITITDDEITYRKKRFRAGKRSAHGGDSIRIRKMIDIEKFCSNQRFRESLAVYQSLDELLGTGTLFQQVHPIFSKTIIIDGEREVDPDLKDLLEQINILKRTSKTGSIRCFSDGAFIGMEGGIEGLCQYLWTINLIIRISKVFQEEEFSFEIMIQGDNVNVLYDIPWHTNNLNELSNNDILALRAIDERVSLNLSESLDRAGMAMNVDESLTSCTLSIYGKEAYNPHQLTLLAKRISVTPWITSETFQDVPTLLSSLTTSMEAASEQSNCPDIVHLFGTVIGAIGWFWLCESQCWEGWTYPLEDINRTFKIRHLEEKDSQSIEEITFKAGRNPLEIISEDLLVSSCIGSALGGLPFPHVLDLEKRGVGDYISHRLAICKLYLDDEDFTLQISLSRYISLPINRRLDYNKLFESPYSLNLVTEEEASAVLKRVTSKFFCTYDIKNDQIADLRKVAEEGLKDFDELLSDSPTLHPRVLHMVRELTVVKEAEKLTQKFSSARTIRDLSIKSGQNVNVGNQLKIKSLDKMCYHIWRKRRSQLETTWECSTTFAKFLRDVSWDKDVQGVTTPSPIEQFQFRRSDDTVSMGHFVEDVSVQFFCDNSARPLSDLTKARGALVPFIGSTTIGQLFRPFYEVKGDPKAKKAANILALLGTLIRFDSNLGKLIRHLGSEILQVSTDDPSSYLSLQDVKSDSSLNDGIRKETMAFNGVINILTHLSHKFWNFSDIRGSRFNRSDILIHGYQSTIKEFRKQSSRALGYFMILKCYSCCIEENDQWADCGKISLESGMGYRSVMPVVRFYQTLHSKIASTSSFRFSSKQQLYFALGLRDGRVKHQRKGGDVSKLRVLEGRYLDCLDAPCYALGYTFGLMVTAREFGLEDDYRVANPSWISTRKILWSNAVQNRIAFSQGLGFLIEDDYFLSVLIERRLLTYLPQSLPTSIADIGISVINLVMNCLEWLEKIDLPHRVCILPPGVLDYDHERKTFHETLLMLKSHAAKDLDNFVYLIEDTVPDPFYFLDEIDYRISEQEEEEQVYSVDLLGNVSINPLAERPLKNSLVTEEDQLEEKKERLKLEETPQTILKRKHLEFQSKKQRSRFINHMPIVGTLSFLRNSCLLNLELIPPDLLIVIGGGLGGCCIPYLLTYPSCKLLFFTLQGERERLSEDRGLIIPPALHNHRLRDRLISDLPLLLSDGNLDNPAVYKAAIKIISEYIGSNQGVNVLLLNEIETSSLYQYPFDGVLYLIKHLREVPNFQVITKLPNTERPTVECFANILGGYSIHPVVCCTSYHFGNLEGSYIFFPKWGPHRTRSELINPLTDPGKIDMKSLEQDKELSAIIRGSIPINELEQMRATVLSQLIRMGIVLKVNNYMKDQLIHELRFGVIRQTRWAFKASKWESRGSSVNQRVSITQEEVGILVLSAWLLHWLATGNWMSDAERVESTPVALVANTVEGLELLPLGYSGEIVLETFRLSQIHPNQKLREGMARLRGLAFILDCPSQKSMITLSAGTHPATTVIQRNRRKNRR